MSIKTNYEDIRYLADKLDRLEERLYNYFKELNRYRALVNEWFDTNDEFLRSFDQRLSILEGKDSENIGEEII